MKKATLLVVEDEAVIARDIRQQLVALGYEVVADTPTAEEALDLVASLRPDLVLMDIHLAGPLDGIAAAQTIRKRDGIPVVFLTAFAGAETLERAKQTEPFGYIIKPFDERSLHTIIEMALYKHRAETHLRRVYDEQAAILRTAPDAFFMTDGQGRLLDVNEASCRMLGYSREEFLTKSLSDLDASPEPVAIPGFDRLSESGTARFDRQHRRKDGTTVFVEISVNYLPRGGGRIFCFARDITERKTAEEALLKLNDELEARVTTRTRDLDEARMDAERANEAKANFLATMTHELRTPLNGVIGTVDLLKQTSLEDHQMEMLDLANESALSLLTIVDDILDFSKMEAGRLGIELLPMSPQWVVEKTCTVLAPMADQADVELTLFTDPQLPLQVLGDPVRLKQVLLNLANNAIKFSSHQDRPGRVSVRALVSGQTTENVTVTFEVADNGIGLDLKSQTSIFDSFTQGDGTIARRFGGTGLGLAITRSLVTLMGGRISVTSELGKGSIFRAVLTFLRPKDKAKAPPNQALEGLSCLVVGEPEGMRADLAAYLAAAGATVLTVPNLDAARQHAGPLTRGLWVWIVDLPGEAPTVEVLRQAAAGRLEPGTRFVLVGRGRRRKPRPIAADVMVVDANLLTTDTFLKAVAATAGRAEIETATTPISVQRELKKPPSREEAKGRRELLLVAEDNEINRKVILRQLGLLGYAADVARNGRQALEMWRSGDHPLLLADLHMPEMDGYQLTAAIRAEESSEQHTVIIALTADALKDGSQQCRDAGLDDYLRKPARLAELRGMLVKWLPHARKAEPAKPRQVATSGSPSGMPVDVAVLEEFVGRDPQVIREFLDAFRTSTTQTASELESAAENMDAPLVAELAHKLKAPARSVGAVHLALICDELERAGKAVDFAALAKWLPVFKAERTSVEEYLRQA